MKFWNRVAGFSLAIVVICAAGLVSAQDQTAGVVRISDLPDVGQQMKLRSYKVVTEGKDCETPTADCETEACEPGAECEGHKVCLHRYTLRNIYWHFKYGHGHHNCWCCFGRCDDDCDDYRDCPPEHCPHCRHGKYCPYHKHNHKKHGRHARRGVAPFGAYTIAYPVNPEYCDGRDGQLYAAQGYGINVTVPLAPNVGAAYNYGWGVPSSRLTPISNPLPVPPISALPGPTPIVIRNR